MKDFVSNSKRSVLTKHLKTWIAIFILSAFVVILVIYEINTYNILRSVEKYSHDRMKLRLLHVVLRHGAKTPDSTYPNDVYVNHTYYPFGWGELTNKGRLNQYRAGQFLRQRYGAFLGDLFSPNLMHAQSTNVDRTYMSCALTMAGLWPTKGTDLDWNPELNWSPIPIESQQLDNDFLLLPKMNCPRYYEEMENVIKSTYITQLSKANDHLLRNLTYITGMTINSPDDILSLYGTLKAQEEFGLQLPEWTKDYYPEKLRPLSELKYLIDGYNDELLRLRIGPLLNKIVSDWSDKMNNALIPAERKLFLYCGHDWTISNLLISLGAWDAQIPSYGIMIMLELYENTETHEFEIELYLRNSTRSEPFPLKIKGCNNHCPLKKLMQLVAHRLPVNWTQECVSKDPKYIPPPPPPY